MEAVVEATAEAAAPNVISQAIGALTPSAGCRLEEVRSNEEDAYAGHKSAAYAQSIWPQLGRSGLKSAHPTNNADRDDVLHSCKSNKICE